MDVLPPPSTSTSTLGKYDDEVCIIVYFAQEFEMITLHSHRVSALFSSRVIFFLLRWVCKKKRRTMHKHAPMLTEWPLDGSSHKILKLVLLQSILRR